MAVSRRAAWLIGLTLVQLALLVATFFWDPLGTELWHHVASLGLTLVLALALYRPLMRSRRFLSTGVLVATVLATLSGFYLLYWKEGIRADGHQDWGVWWHVFWSWIAMVFFFQHTWINRVQFGHFFRRTFRHAGPALLHAGGYVALVAAFAVTWSGTGRTWFTNANYITLSLAAWLVATVPPYTVWLAARSVLVRARQDAPIRRFVDHWPVRRVIDLVLVPTAALVVLSGLPLLFFDEWLDLRGFKYVSKYWHVWPSVLFSVLVFGHAVQAWRTVRAHWRAWGLKSAA